MLCVIIKRDLCSLAGGCLFSDMTRSYCRQRGRSWCNVHQPGTSSLHSARPERLLGLESSQARVAPLLSPSPGRSGKADRPHQFWPWAFPTHTTLGTLATTHPGQGVSRCPRSYTPTPLSTGQHKTGWLCLHPVCKGWDGLWQGPLLP